MIQSKTLKALAIAMAGSALVLGGCNDDDGGGGGSTPVASYDGTGTEVLGNYIAEVISSTGIYAEDGHYAPAGLTRHVNLYFSGGSLYLGYNTDISMDDYDGDAEMVADPVTGTYSGSTSWMPDFGALSYDWISEEWTVSFTGDTVTLTVSGEGPTVDDVGTITFVLRPLAAFPSDAWSYGKGSSHTDGRYVGQSSYQGVYESSYDGAEGEIYTDAAYEWSDYFWAPLYRAGNTLRGGMHADTSYQADYADVFATLSFTLDTLGNPSAASVTVSDYNALDDDGDTDVEPAQWSASVGGFQHEDLYAVAYDGGANYDLTITSVTGAELELAFGSVDDVLVDAVGFSPYGNPGQGVEFYASGNRFWGGYVSSTRREIVAWDGRYYDYNDDYIGYDFDGDPLTEERLTIIIDYDDTVLPAIPVGGSLKLEVYDPAGTLTSTENMAFTLANPGGAP